MRRWLPLLGALALMVAGCSPAREGHWPQGKDCLRAGNLSDPGSLDPVRAFVKQDQTVINDLLVGLTTYDAEGRIVPGMATSWERSSDGLTWRFHLRDAFWSDGAPVTANDFVYSFRRLIDPATAASYAILIFPFANAEAISRGKAEASALGVSAPDLRTVEIRLANPVPYLPQVLAHYGVAPVPEHAVRRWGDRWSEPGRFVSNGPFRLSKWRLGDRIVLEKNARFYDAARVCLDRVEYFPTADSIAAERRVKRGELDLNSAFAWNRSAFMQRGSMAPFVRVHPWTDVYYVVFRLSDRRFADRRVRQALTMAIDRPFVARVMAGGQHPTNGFVPPGLGGLPASPDWSHLPLAERQARARALLAAAGYGPRNPLRFELKAPAGGRGLSAPVVLQAEWRAIGVDVRLSGAEIAVFFADLQRGDFEAALTDWIADYRDPTNFLDLMRSDQSSSNYGGWIDPAYDALLAQARRERDPQRRSRLLQSAEQRMLQDAAVAPLFVNPSHNLVSPRLTGWRDNLDDVHPKRWMCTKGHPLAEES